jgi:signal peptidase I
VLPIAVEPATSYATFLVNVVGAVHGYRIAAGAGPFVPRAWFARWYFLLLLYIIPVVLALVVRTFLWEPFYAPAASMEPNLRVGDHLFVSKYAYRLGEPQRGDVAVFLLPSDNATAYVKRLAGLPGDRIQMKAGSLYINGERVPQEEIEQPAGEPGELYRETLPSGRSYLIRDMMEHGPLDDTDVFEVPPGHYFFLGDNRDNSLDSRMSDPVGYVPRANLIGPLVLIYWNSETQRFRLFDEE